MNTKLRIKELERALEESIRLQGHYAFLLNGYDGGQRMIFMTSEDWMMRLNETMGKMNEKEKET